jgi:hypothetical protein
LLNCRSENRKSSSSDGTKLEAEQALDEGKTATSVLSVGLPILEYSVGVFPLMGHL